MKFKNMMIISMLVLLLSIGIVSASDNVTDDALPLGDIQDDNPVGVVKGSTFDDVQKAVDQSKKDDVVEIEGTFSAAKKPIVINKDLTIQASSKGATLDGKKQSQIFDIRTANVVLKDLFIINSADSAINFGSDGKKLTIINCTFESNGGSNCDDGGALFAIGEKATIINSTFKNNQAYYGGAIYGYSKFDISGCIFRNNNAKDEGGAVFSYSDVNVDDCQFESNSAVQYGGAIYVEGNLKIAKSFFKSNTADIGGAVYALANTTISESVFNKNTAKTKGGTVYCDGHMDSKDIIYDTLAISGSQITDSKAGTNGAAIYAHICNVKLNDVSISCIGTCEDIYMEIGDFSNVGSSFKSIKRLTKSPAKISAKKMTTMYDSGQYFKVQMTDADGNKLINRMVKIRVYTGKKYKDYVREIADEDYFFAFLEITRDLSVGKHKVVVTSMSKYYDAKKVTTYIIVKKAQTVVKAPKVKAKHKKSKLFKVTVKHKQSRKKVKKVKIKIKVYTGKKSKIFKVKTNKKGVASINTKKFKRGTHKVKITSKNKNYIISKTSKIIIK